MSTAGPSSSGGLSAASHAAASHADAESLALMKRLQEEDDAALAAQLMAQDTGRCSPGVCALKHPVFPDRAG